MPADMAAEIVQAAQQALTEYTNEHEMASAIKAAVSANHEGKYVILSWHQAILDGIREASLLTCFDVDWAGAHRT